MDTHADPPVALEQAFDVAAREHRLVVLELGAVWCHWCHVMEEQTFGDPDVRARLDAHFVTVHVDQDARPDLSQRYEDWGWPATVVFRADGTELARLRGYIPPNRFASILDAFVADPTPGPSAIDPPVLASTDAELLARWDGAWDEAEGGWGRITKALDGPSVLLALALGDPAHEAQARRTVSLQRALVDPVWGGAYQYSDSGDWKHPHYEKIAAVQADDLRAFALGWARWGDPADRDAARAIARYLDGFLWDPAGGYRASQDADLVQGEHAAGYFALDDAGRRALGLPRIDPHRYAEHAGLLAAALADASGWLGDDALLGRAIRAARWAIDARGLPGGGFRHDDGPGAATPYLADTLAMVEAFVALHDATADPAWLGRAEVSLSYVDATFRTDQGYAATPAASPLHHREQNARLVVVADALARRTGDPRWSAMADHALAWARSVASDGNAAPLVLASLARTTDPLHVVVVGPAADPRTIALHRAARALPVARRQLERVDRSDDRPSLGQPAAWVCSGSACAAPVTDPDGLRAAWTQVTRQVPR